MKWLVVIFGLMGTAAPSNAAQEATATVSGPAKAAVPDAEAVGLALRTVKERLFPALYGDLSTPEKTSELIVKLLDSSADPSLDVGSPDQYVLLTEACELALRIFDLAAAFDAIDRLDEAFDFDSRARKIAALVEAASHPFASEHEVIADVGLDLIEESIQADSIEEAESLVQAIRPAAELWLDSLGSRWGDALAVIAGYKEVQPAIEALQSDPADAEANLAVGHYFCFGRGNFARGLPLLKLASDPELSKLAELDLADPATPELRWEVGKRWHEWATQQPNGVRLFALRRSESWLNRAHAELRNLSAIEVGGLLKALAEEIEVVLVALDAERRSATSAAAAFAVSSDRLAAMREALTLARRKADSRLKTTDKTLASVTARKSLSTAVAPMLSAARDLGLLWLAAHVSAHGGWSSKDFADECSKIGDDAICDGPGDPQFDVGVTALSLLCFLRSGHGPVEGEYASVVRNGLVYLADVQSPDGNFGIASKPLHTYDHVIATLAMIEGSVASGGNPRFRQPAEKGVAYLLSIRNPNAAWRYPASNKEMKRSGKFNDMSVTGWAIQILVKTREAGLSIDAEELGAALSDALTFLEDMTDPVSGRTGYFDRGGLSAREGGYMAQHWDATQSESMTAVGVFCRYLADPGLKRPGTKEMIDKGVELMLGLSPIWKDGLEARRDFYYWLHGTEALARHGGQAWARWKRDLSRVVVERARGAGERAGSWDPQEDLWGGLGGRVYSTSMLVLAATEALQRD